ncbi:hypothetical protein [Aquabacterium sp.]|uniref:hypothetical protein n=1 Tax=Aquabacterium sp. TaxID=1872578 RepID=UPI002C693BC5|nr:hypothetical protein [Aquabacterium sp.]HSW04870.1 hypothetical protein [Aquabacterium sp.]
MRAAPPPVELGLGKGRRERAVVAMLHGLAACAVTAWLLQRHGEGSPASAGGAVLLVFLIAAASGGALLGWFVVPPLQGRLRWDGAGWSHVDEGNAAVQALKAVQLQLDLGSWVLLRAVRLDRRPALWCGVTALEAGAAWHGLRLALYHRPPDSSAQQGLP